MMFGNFFIHQKKKNNVDSFFRMVGVLFYNYGIKSSPSPQLIKSETNTEEVFLKWWQSFTSEQSSSIIIISLKCSTPENHQSIYTCAQQEISVGTLNYYELLELFQQKVKTWSPAWELNLDPLLSCWSCMLYVRVSRLCRATCMVSHTIYLFNLPRFVYVYGVAKASGPRAFCLLCFLTSSLGHIPPSWRILYLPSPSLFSS